MTACNCIICAKEFNSEELSSLASLKVNFSKFKICEACLSKCDPEDDFKSAIAIVNSYNSYTEAKSLFSEVKSLLK